MARNLGQPPVDFNPIEVEFGSGFPKSLDTLEVDVEFPFLCNTSEYMPSGKPLKVMGVELDENPSNSLITVAVHSMAGLPRAYGNIQVIGGAAGFDLDDVPNMDDLLKGVEGTGALPDAFVHARDIYRAANELGANIITGGTQSGVMALISSIWLADHVLNAGVVEAVSKRARLLQEDPRAIYNGSGPALIHFVPRSATIYPGNDEVSKDEWPSPLAPCSAFVSVKGAGGWGEEGSTLEKSAYVTSFIPAYDHAVASLPRLDSQYSSRVAVVMNGGGLTVLEAKRALEADYPASLVVLNGTGRFADLLAASIENNYQVPGQDHQVWTEKLRKDFSKESYQKSVNAVLDHLRGNPGQAYVFHAGNEGLTSRIRSIMTDTPM